MEVQRAFEEPGLLVRKRKTVQLPFQQPDSAGPGCQRSRPSRDGAADRVFGCSLVSRLLVATGDTCREVGNLRVGRSGTWMGQWAEAAHPAAVLRGRQALHG